jgi:hypothetical protein
MALEEKLALIKSSYETFFINLALILIYNNFILVIFHQIILLERLSLNFNFSNYFPNKIFNNLIYLIFRNKKEQDN